MPAPRNWQLKRALTVTPSIPGSGAQGRAYAKRSRSVHMSMNEFEEQSHKREKDSDTLLTHGQVFPQDFSEEDIAFAQELNSFFALEEEKVPPYFAQTLLEPENPRFQVAGYGFEEKTRARVFRRLNLRRRLFNHRCSSRGVIPVLPLRHSCLLVVPPSLLSLLFPLPFPPHSSL